VRLHTGTDAGAAYKASVSSAESGLAQSNLENKNAKGDAGDEAEVGV
jgi:hypothetical protein